MAKALTRRTSRSLRRALAVGLLALPPCAAAADPLSNRIPGETRAYFQDWLAACRPGGYCSALAYVNPDEWRADHWLRVGSAAAGVDYEILYVAIASQPSEQATLEIWIDGRKAAALEPQADLGWSREPGDAANEHRVSQSVANLTLLPAMRRGARLTVIAAEPDGERREMASFSLTGLTAALRWLEVGRQE